MGEKNQAGLLTHSARSGAKIAVLKKNQQPATHTVCACIGQLKRQEIAVKPPAHRGKASVFCIIQLKEGRMD